MKVNKVFENVFKVDSRLATQNLVPGEKVYGEELVYVEGIEYRMWNPYRSKLAAAILNGLKEFHIKEGSSVLYLGAANGTTCSHVSDIIGKKGIIFCIEISERSMRDLVKVCEKRENMLPILADARNVEQYEKDAGEVDIIYEDVSSRDQAEILLANSNLLKRKGYAYVAIKSQSIDTARKPSEVYEEFIDKISSRFKVLESIKLEPFHKKHLFVVLEKI
ncbi:MAG: fibrillarin-like rRNA/tRNA 2'-O-methyltransferase [Candidatus Micrarchaeia archaeon]